jgi:hypothetical protein
MIALLLTLALGAGDCSGGQCSATRGTRPTVQVNSTRTVQRERTNRLFHRRGTRSAGCK